MACQVTLITALLTAAGLYARHHLLGGTWHPKLQPFLRSMHRVYVHHKSPGTHQERSGQLGPESLREARTIQNRWQLKVRFTILHALGCTTMANRTFPAQPDLWYGMQLIAA